MSDFSPHYSETFRFKKLVMNGLLVSDTFDKISVSIVSAS